MVDPDELPRHIDGSVAVIDQPNVKITFQHGAPIEEGINGCRVEDVIDLLVDKLLEFQSRNLACQENDTALYHLGLASEALLARRRLREQQGLIGTDSPHVSG